MADDPKTVTRHVEARADGHKPYERQPRSRDGKPPEEGQNERGNFTRRASRT